MNIGKIPSHILEDLRSRGLSDEEIGNACPERLFTEFCNWNGLTGWGGTLITTLDELRAADSA